ncbi:EAL domain-containing protein, partial [Streptococcus pyogenes]
IRKAIQGNELMLHFQPQVDLKTQRIVGIEALVRWQDEGGTIISPDTIVRTAEDTGLMQQLGNWIINKALEHYAMLLTE